MKIYKVQVTSHRSAEAVINTTAADGWDLHSVSALDIGRLVLVFEREGSHPSRVRPQKEESVDVFVATPEVVGIP